eukprot:1773576-Prymnesium_polylepis.1
MPKRQPPGDACPVCVGAMGPAVSLGVAFHSFVLGANSSSSRVWPGASDHLLILHMPKTGGTSFRNILQEAARRGHTVQAHYEADIPNFRDFDADAPAQIIMGHAVNFHMLQPTAPGRTLRYTTMLRSPLSWVLSLYFHFHQTRDESINTKLLTWVQGLFTTCPGLMRGTNATRCGQPHLLSTQLYGWYSGGAPAVPDKCASFASFFSHPSRLLLVFERYEESIWLLYQLLGWDSPTDELAHLNSAPKGIYEQSVTLDTVNSIAAIIDQSCLSDIYAAARQRFDRVYRLARAYCTDRDPCDLASSWLGHRLWTPVTGEGTRVMRRDDQ